MKFGYQYNKYYNCIPALAALHYEQSCFQILPATYKGFWHNRVLIYYRLIKKGFVLISGGHAAPRLC